MGLQTSEQRSVTLILNRLGQTLDVNIFKLTVKETVEDRKVASPPARVRLIRRHSSATRAEARTGQCSAVRKSCRNITKLTLNDLWVRLVASTKAAADVLP